MLRAGKPRRVSSGEIKAHGAGKRQHTGRAEARTGHVVRLVLTSHHAHDSLYGRYNPVYILVKIQQLSVLRTGLFAVSQSCYIGYSKILHFVGPFVIMNKFAAVEGSHAHTALSTRALVTSVCGPKQLISIGDVVLHAIRSG